MRLIKILITTQIHHKGSLKYQYLYYIILYIEYILGYKFRIKFYKSKFWTGTYHFPFNLSFRNWAV